MLCPRCQADLPVTGHADASTPGLNLELRDRKCRSCGNVLRTKEVEDLARQKSARHFARSLLEGKLPLPLD